MLETMTIAPASNYGTWFWGENDGVLGIEEACVCVGEISEQTGTLSLCSL